MRTEGEEDCRGCVGERTERPFDLHSKLAIDIRSPRHGESREPRIKAYNFHVRRDVSLCAGLRAPHAAAGVGATRLLVRSSEVQRVAGASTRVHIAR